MKRDRRGSWYLLTGIVLGVTMGLIYSWVISPVKYVDAPPYALRSDYKDDYRALVAAAYLYSGDLVRAEDRLKQLRDYDTAQSLALQAQQALADGHPEAEIRALSLLANTLNQAQTPTASLENPTLANTLMPTLPGLTTTPVPEQLTGTPTILPDASLSATMTQPLPQPSVTEYPTQGQSSTPTQGAPFILDSTELVCNPNQAVPLLQVVVLDAAGTPVPSMEIIVTTDKGEDHFFTGLKPELGLGYADFLMQPEVEYSLRLAHGGDTVNNLLAKECTQQDGSQYWGSWLVTFMQP